ncbi:glucose-1-phosphate adenylyltransferase [Porcincola intestinalis]|uniref:Glucose-1-phosphate adenylyltransferase n=1 Tax=Porcincola intestinalis TaxID=2606632 RepID=A0A6L5X231_9FIRM|nr:glucose-1-phosphate adenylyltransferase [Porcincola intestinalis]MSS13695.1 glucose-1-phosphate adenylyltransferase [Porcincola intestinalis]
MKQGNMLAMILAGGRGSRLHELTSKVAKPAVSYGGKYRIIDFPLSNCANSGVNIVGVLTQYESVLLNSYVAGGGRWGLDTKDSGVFVLTPREKAETGLDVYRGTADAISQNIDFIDQYNPEFLLVLSGDHIYKMDYSEMLKAHIKAEADATIAVIGVPIREASRFGIMNTDETGRIVEFEEKPEHPKSNLASMGIYIFNWKLLRKMLVADMKDSDSAHDFGKNIIPQMLADGKTLLAYEFKGYWKDVGTIDSLWEANMDLLDKKDELDLGAYSWKIYTADVSTLPAYIGDKAETDRVYITQGCECSGKVTHTVMFTNSKVAEGATVTDSVLMPGAVVEEGATVTRAMIANGVRIGKGAVVGSADSEHIELVSKNVKGVE